MGPSAFPRALCAGEARPLAAVQMDFTGMLIVSSQIFWVNLNLFLKSLICKLCIAKIK